MLGFGYNIKSLFNTINFGNEGFPWYFMIYFVFEGSRITNLLGALSWNVYLHLWLCPHVVFWRFIRIVRPILLLLLFFKSFQFFICIEFIPSFIVLPHSIDVSNQVLLLFRILLLNLSNRWNYYRRSFFWGLCFGNCIFANLLLYFFFDLHLLLPFVKVTHVLFYL